MPTVGCRMYDSVCLIGQVILIVDDEEEPFAQQLQAALERVGAETMLACTLGSRTRSCQSLRFFDSGDLRRWRNSHSRIPATAQGAGPYAGSPLRRGAAPLRVVQKCAVSCSIQTSRRGHRRGGHSITVLVGKTFHAEFSLSRRSWPGVRLRLFYRPLLSTPQAICAEPTPCVRG